MTLRIGLDYLYVVQDIEDLIHRLLDQQTVEFGKNLPTIRSNIAFNGKYLSDVGLVILYTPAHAVDQSWAVTANGSELYIPPQMLKDVLLATKESRCRLHPSRFFRREPSCQGSI